MAGYCKDCGNQQCICDDIKSRQEEITAVYVREIGVYRKKDGDFLKCEFQKFKGRDILKMFCDNFTLIFFIEYVISIKYELPE